MSGPSALSVGALLSLPRGCVGPWRSEPLRRALWVSGHAPSVSGPGALSLLCVRAGRSLCRASAFCVGASLCRARRLCTACGPPAPIRATHPRAPRQPPSHPSDSATFLFRTQLRSANHPSSPRSHPRSHPRPSNPTNHPLCAQLLRAPAQIRVSLSAKLRPACHPSDPHPPRASPHLQSAWPPIRCRRSSSVSRDPRATKM